MKYISENKRCWRWEQRLLSLTLLLLQLSSAVAQITIGGNVYGGGNAGVVSGQSAVKVYGGTVKGSVYGGARQADVKGSAFVHIDGSKMSDDIIIKTVCGGNDISGTVGRSLTLPSDLQKASENGIDATYNAFVKTSEERPAGESETQRHIFIGTVYGGGNGDYQYVETTNDKGLYEARDKQSNDKVVATSKSPFEKPVQDKVYLEIMGGTIAYLYGGGNNATVELNNDIYINNHSQVTTVLPSDAEDDQEHNLLRQEGWLESMGIAMLGDDAVRDSYQFSRVFGGNNKAVMRIQPTWHLIAGKIDNLYSGGNEGDMSSPSGLLLEINPQISDDEIPSTVAEADRADYIENAKKFLVINNVYGGCRKADVRPQKLKEGTTNEYEDTYAPILDGYKFPAGFSARVLVRGGDINNVYGGNDISGRVYGGNAVGVYSSIKGNIYGGGNGSYPYTDRRDLASTLKYGDYYYDPAQILGITGIITPLQSLQALNQHRPDAEQVSIRVKGEANKRTVIGGAIYVGGNSATLRTTKTNPLVELKVGSYVTADNVYLGNNGREMVQYGNANDVLNIYKSEVGGNRYASFDLTDPEQFSAYMDAAAMDLKPSIVFDKKSTEGVDYVPYSTWFGSFYCGGNVGSMTYAGTNTMNFNVPVYIYDKIVGGCNDAYVAQSEYNAAYYGGIRGSSGEQDGFTEIVDGQERIKDRLVLNFQSAVNSADASSSASYEYKGVQIRPMRWKYDEQGNKTELVLNTVDGDGNPVDAIAPEDYVTPRESDKDDLERRFAGGNIYGGCHNSGYVNGNVVINLESNLVDRDQLFDKVEQDSIGEAVYYDNDNYKILKRRSGVILGQQGMDVLGKALNVFGGGKGKDTQIWGSTTINLKKGYTFQIFGGSQEGVIGKPDGKGVYTFGDNKYSYNPAYSCTINVHGSIAGISKTSKQEDGTIVVNNNPEMAMCEFIYGGGFEGPVCGNTTINLGNGRVFNTFAGACNADILGHTETYIGRSGQVDANGQPVLGFPWIRDYVYGGNDLGGEIKGSANFQSRVRTASSEGDFDVLSKVYRYDSKENTNPTVLNASAYVEYVQGRAEGIFGGCYGAYDYTDPKYEKYTYTRKPVTDDKGNITGYTYTDDSSNESNVGQAKEGFTKPYMDNAFVNFRPRENLPDRKNAVGRIFGAGQGYSGEKQMDQLQERSYVLIDIPDAINNYQGMDVFGAGSYGGLGMKNYVAPGATNSDNVSAVIDLMRGQIGSVYGASYNEGFTRRTVVNVPKGSTIQVQNIFGGAYGVNNDAVCDAYESNVNYHSADGLVRGKIYGGNNSFRRTLYGRINIDVPVWHTPNDSLATIFGAGYGVDTWSQYTEVNLNDGARIMEVYGGGEMGKVANKATATRRAVDEGGVLTIDSRYAAVDGLDNNALVTAGHDGKKYNTNVIIRKGAEVRGYAYGGGKGVNGMPESGDVNGTTYIALLGGTVTKDVYAAGTIGAVLDKYGKSVLGDGYFKASANAYIAGGTLRNVYGGGWKGSVGYHPGKTDHNGVLHPTDPSNDIYGETVVTIGIRNDQPDAEKQKMVDYVKGLDDNAPGYGYYCGVPAIQRNAYSGGEGGSVYGTAHLILNNAYVGFTYNETTGAYEEKLDDETWEDHKGENRLKDCGNVFGGGYDDRSVVDSTDVVMWGGVVRSSVHGGGEIATVGRGKMEESGSANEVRNLQAIYKAGGTKVTMYNGHVYRNVFGGGKGYNLLGFGGGNKLYTDGYTFGSTEVYIHGGEIGTVEGVAESKGGYGNVFGGGDIGYVYSRGFFTKKTVDEVNISTGSPNHHYYYVKKDDDDDEYVLTEDCKVVVAPYLQVKKGETLGTYQEYEYVPTDSLNTLPKKDKATGRFSGDWEKLYTGANNGVEGATDDTVERGVVIHNAVFAGGNVSSNSDKDYANATTVHGNTTATLYDVYHRDFITVGTEHIGGLYGGGNLSVVDGYRELNITNYGTDYYGLESQIDLETYRGLSNRERAYFQLQYQCKNDVTFGDVTYQKDDKITEEEYLHLVEVYTEERASEAFTPYGFCSIYAGRLLNTIQRADLCGVYGSRMVLQGAKDRVAHVGENIDYTINRVGELSLNQQHSVRNETTDEDASHGNYFGIYSIVNYLGNLTSDVRFGDPCIGSDGGPVYIDNNKQVVRTVEEDGQTVNVKDLTEEQKNKYGLTQTTYYSYKAAHPTSTNRNKGMSSNQVALASGVFLELTTEESEKSEKKVYGYITGVVELDLINVQTEMGGGFVYAKNEHRVPVYYPNKPNVILSAYNKENTLDGKQLRAEARTYKRYQYSLDSPGDWSSDGSYVISGDDEHKYEEMVFQTSGNFIHPSKRIVDDCYPINNAYKLGGTPLSEAHYWYVKGEVYIYDQKVSAYTGSATAYAKEVPLPLTITAASHGELKLLNVKPNLYAYYAPKDGDPAATTKVKLGTTKAANGKPVDEVFVNNESQSFHLNDVITWWDWHKLSEKERGYFVAETIVNTDTCTIDGVGYKTGAYAMTPTDFETFKGENHVIEYINDDGDDIRFSSNDTSDDAKKELESMFRSSNNISHEAGYVLTFDMSTPGIWDNYYILRKNSDETTTRPKVITTAAYNNLSTSEKSYYQDGPTFAPKTSRVYGGHNMVEGNIVTETAHDNNQSSGAVTEPAYVVSSPLTYTIQEDDGQGGSTTTTKALNPGTAISKTELDKIVEEDVKSQFAEAYVCKRTLQLATKHYLTKGQLYTHQELEDLKTQYADLKTDIDEVTEVAYICTKAGEFGGYQMNAGENYNALEAWCSLTKQDRIGSDGHELFTYNFDALDLLADADYLKVVDASGNYVIATPSESRTQTAFHQPFTKREKVEYDAVYNDETPRELSYKNRNGQTVKESFTTGHAPLTNAEFETLRNDKHHYTKVSVKAGGNDIYIATENFTYNGIPYGKGQVVDEKVKEALPDKVEQVHFDNDGHVTATWYYCYEDYDNNEDRKKGTMLTAEQYANLQNDQQWFIIQGREPIETTTLYVSSESDAKDVVQEKVISVVYQYTYYEEEDDGSSKLTNELHVVNVHLVLESGVPNIGTLYAPPTVLPGNSVGLTAPEVEPGIWEVYTNGWERFASEEDARRHRNGVPFTNNSDPVYWYQNQKEWIAFYSETYLGKTYSNSVPLSVANYHDLAAVMADKEHHLHVDYDPEKLERDCKIYINDYSADGKNGLDELKDFFNLSYGDALDGHKPLSNHIAGLDNLEIILRSDLDYSGNEWTPLGNDAVSGARCFGAMFHGDGHTISGLDHSLFKNLCGNVYNLGVTGKFKSAGVADTGDGFVENCWVMSDQKTMDGGVRAVFGRPTATSGKQLVNCYYLDTNAYSTVDEHQTGLARPMPQKAFSSGEVAYNLNGFYLAKRYYDGIKQGSGKKYRYLRANADGTLPEKAGDAWYPTDYAYYPLTGEHQSIYGYVENRYADGDFIYAGGYLPTDDNIRLRQEQKEGSEETTAYYAPIWPDDYLYFGQVLNYGYGNVTAPNHQVLPNPISKRNERLLTANGNRVYRAPAYYSSGKMESVYFNPNAIFAKNISDDPTTTIHKGLTAIDFSGGNGDVAGGYHSGLVTTIGTTAVSPARFYPPLLDDDGIIDFATYDLTRNLLVYTGTATPAATMTNGVIETKLHDAPYSYSQQYNTIMVGYQDPHDVYGHWVQQLVDDSGEDYVAPNDHLLVDREDFNCPISYTFDSGRRMWYQRKPQPAVYADDNYVSLSTGWQGISIPFTAELVTTDQKGEITHFYSGSKTAENSDAKIGHEYWLREYRGITTTSAEIATATFNYPDAVGTDTKEVGNTFLWDYYYEGNHGHNDTNGDKYQDADKQREYYSKPREFKGYPLLQTAKPYLIGFPGPTYYEFDLSGQWTATSTGSTAPAALERQTITFVSAEGATIGVSDTELEEQTKPYKGFSFRPNYLNVDAAEGTYLMANGGGSYDKVTSETAATARKLSPFRPYFVATTNGAPRLTRSIVFDSDGSQFAIGDERESQDGNVAESVDIRTGKRRVVVTSRLRHKADVRIFNAGGLCVATFDVEPGQTIEHPILHDGIYVVHVAGGRYRSKLAVR